MKNIDYDPVHRLDLFTLPAENKAIENYLKKIARDGNPITENHPWTIQRFIDGTMWSTCQVQIGGEVCLYTCTKSTASCFNWNHEDNQQIKAWADGFAKKLKIDGIFTNDFIIDKYDGVAYAIECNPRLGSQVSLFHSQQDMADVILGKHAVKMVEPKGDVPTYTTLNELFVLLDPSYYADEELN